MRRDAGLRSIRVLDAALIVVSARTTLPGALLEVVRQVPLLEQVGLEHVLADVSNAAL
jgi:hypothetical protein